MTKLINVDYILKALEAFKQGNDTTTLNVGGSRANDQDGGAWRRGSREEATAVMQEKDDECLIKSSGTGYGEV